MADLLAGVQDRFDGVQLGSYPFWRDGRGGANFVVRSTDAAVLADAIAELKAGLLAAGVEPVEGEI